MHTHTHAQAHMHTHILISFRHLCITFSLSFVSSLYLISFFVSFPSFSFNSLIKGPPMCHGPCFQHMFIGIFPDKESRTNSFQSPNILLIQISFGNYSSHSYSRVRKGEIREKDKPFFQRALLDDPNNTTSYITLAQMQSDNYTLL